jgi:hypothetical protein
VLSVGQCKTLTFARVKKSSQPKRSNRLERAPFFPNNKSFGETRISPILGSFPGIPEYLGSFFEFSRILTLLKNYSGVSKKIGAFFKGVFREFLGIFFREFW